MDNTFVRELNAKALLLFSIGIFLGALANTSTFRNAVIALSLLGIVAMAALIGWKKSRIARGRSQRAAAFLALRAPDPEAATFASNEGVNAGSVVGKVIEIWSHHSLDTMIPLKEIGIEPNHLIFTDSGPDNFSEVLRRCGGLRRFPPPNNPKYGIRSLFIGTKDDQDYRVRFFSTDWETWMSVRTVIEHDPTLRWEYSHVQPEINALPQSMSLQFLVRFSNGDVLALRRKSGLGSEADKWSFSGEEQISEEDFKATGASVAEYLFRRAFLEEVFGHRGDDPEFKMRVWTEDISQLIASHRIWSFFLEENTGIFQLFGVYQLNVDAQRLRAERERATSAGWGTDDHEGSWYTVSEPEILQLLDHGTCTAIRLHGDAELARITARSLHATSRYRLWRLYRALARKGETLTELHLSSLY